MNNESILQNKVLRKYKLEEKIKKYKENTKNYENEISISDDMVYRKRR